MVNNRIRSLAPAMPFIALTAVDGATITSTPTALSWGAVCMKTTELHYVAGDDRIAIKRGGSGIYEICIAICVEKATGNPGHSIVQLYVNGVAMPAESHGFMGAVGQHSSTTLNCVAYLTEGDYVQAYVYVNNGSGTLEANTGRFKMKQLTMKGWDNGAGGSAVSDRRK